MRRHVPVMEYNYLNKIHYDTQSFNTFSPKIHPLYWDTTKPTPLHRMTNDEYTKNTGELEELHEKAFILMYEDFQKNILKSAFWKKHGITRKAFIDKYIEPFGYLETQTLKKHIRRKKYLIPK